MKKCLFLEHIHTVINGFGIIFCFLAELIKGPLSLGKIETIKMANIIYEENEFHANPKSVIEMALLRYCQMLTRACSK